jgi:hypothetical protein
VDFLGSGEPGFLGSGGLGAHYGSGRGCPAHARLQDALPHDGVDDGRLTGARETDEPNDEHSLFFLAKKTDPNLGCVKQKTKNQKKQKKQKPKNQKNKKQKTKNKKQKTKAF